jgi:malonyl-CoA/methylmalonyl-CoA synthetase
VSGDAEAWARHGFHGRPAELLAEGTLPRAWAARWAAAPAAPAVGGPDGRFLGGAQLEARTAEVAARFARAGLVPGDRILMSASSSVELVVAHVAALRLGLVVVPANPAYGPAEIQGVAEQARPALAVLDDAGRLPGIASVGPGVDLPPGPPPTLDAAGGDDPALLLFTSGTTGTPKGVLLDHANLLASSAAIGTAWRWTADDRLVLSLPLFHLHGLGVGLHGTLLAGASVVLLPRFTPDLVLDAAAATGATLLFGVPTMWVRLAASGRGAELGRLRLCVSGSAPLAAVAFEALANRCGTRVVERYGMTETGMLTSNPVEGERRPGSVGLPLPGVSVRLSEGGEAEGEVLVRGPGVFSGYGVEAGRRDTAAFDDGWFRTGDLGRFDGDGYLHLVGRAKDLIITGGYNVHPRQVEEALAGHPAVAEAAVVGVPDAEWGERVVAYVVAREPLGEADLLAFAAEHLAGYKRPRQIRFVDILPRNAMGKVVKADLR